MIPVPAALPDAVAVWNTVLMSTTAGSTVAAIADACRAPPLYAEAGWVTATIGAVAERTVLVPAVAVFVRKKAAPITATRATVTLKARSRRHSRRWDLGGGAEPAARGSRDSRGGLLGVINPPWEPGNSLEKRSTSDIEATSEMPPPVRSRPADCIGSKMPNAGQVDLWVFCEGAGKAAAVELESAA